MAEKKGRGASKPRRRSLPEDLAALDGMRKVPAALENETLPALSPDGTLTREVLRLAVSGALEAFRARLRDEIARDVRDAFSVRLLEIWRDRAFHGRWDWILGAVGVLGGDRAALMLGGFLPSWPAESDTGRRRAIAALPVLREIGTDTALLVLIGLRHQAVVPSVLEAAVETLEQALSDRGTTYSALLDRVTPTLGLDERGERTLEHDGRALTIAFDAHFEPRVRDVEGRALEETPPGATWEALLGQLREAVKVQTFRLEQDMIEGRRWDASGWTRNLQRHPLLVSFTRRLLWGLYQDDTLVTAFRTAEDRTLVGLDDREVTLPRRASIGLVHPLQLDEETRRAWAEHFSDYEIISPFPQLARVLHRAPESEREAKATAWFAEQRFKSGLLRDVLVRRGWTRDPSFVRMYYRRAFPGHGVAAFARLLPGVAAGAATYDRLDQSVPGIEFRKIGPKGKASRTLSVAEVPPIAFSEAILDLLDVLAEQHE